MKHFLSILALIATPLFAQNTDWYTGDSPYEISTAAELEGLAQLVNSGTNFSGKTITLTANIALEGSWTPIGDNSAEEKRFAGTFDGDGHTISNLSVSGVAYAGLFGCVEADGQIKNVKIIATEIRGTQYAGTLAGYYGSAKPIENIGAEADSIIATATASGYYYSYSGGLVGYVSDAITITDSYASGNVSANASDGSYSGGLVGFANSALIITNSYASGNVSANANLISSSGGLVGFANGALIITDSHASGNVSANASNSHSGGLVGYNNSNGTITNSYASGNVSATPTAAYSGGLVGRANGELTIANSYASGNVSATASGNASYSGGLVGAPSGSLTITNSYASGNISASGSAAYKGGIFGSYSYASGTNTSVYFNSEGGASSAAGDGSPEGISELSPEDLKKKDSFVGWDFEETWDIAEGSSYPFLRALPPPDIWIPHNEVEITYIFNQTYNGLQITPEPKIRLSEGKTLLTKGEDYTLSYGENKNVGEGTVSIEGIGSHIGLEESATFNIIPKAVTVSLEPKSLTITLLEELPDFESMLSYDGFVGGETEEVITAGTTAISHSYVKGTSPVDTYPLELSGELSASNYTFSYDNSNLELIVIDPLLTSSDVSAIPPQEYTGAPIKPSVTVSHNSQLLTEETDYDLEYGENVNVLSGGSVVVKGKGKYAGVITKTFAISPKALEESMVSAIPSQIYTGETIEPAFTITHGAYTLTENTDYSIDGYTGNTDIGTGIIAVSGLGNYAGTVNLTFEIVAPDEPSIANGNFGVNFDLQVRNGMLWIAAPLSGVRNDAKVQIYSLNGTKIRSFSFAGGVYSVSLKGLAKGLYIVKANFGSQRNEVVKKVMVN